MDFGKQLQNLIDQKNLTQRQLAKALHINASTLNGYIKNQRQPDLEMLVRIASYFDTTTDYLLGYSPGKKSKKKIPPKLS